jgi:hypothetical protein
MKDAELYAKVRYAVRIQGLSKRAVARLRSDVSEHLAIKRHPELPSALLRGSFFEYSSLSHSCESTVLTFEWAA